MREIIAAVAREFYADIEKMCQDLSEEGLQQTVELISAAPKVFVAAIGHSNLIAQVLTMKLNHLGKRAYQVFDIVNPPFEEGDLLIVISQSGETSTLLSLARRAKSLRGKVLGLTSCPHSSLSNLSDALLKIKVKHDDVDFVELSNIGDVRHGNLSGALFGIALYVTIYALIVILMARWGEDAEKFDRRHANLQ